MLAGMVAANTATAASPPRARAGVVDLAAWHLEREGPLVLKGE